MKQDRITLVLIQVTPRFIRDVELGQYATPVEENRLSRMEVQRVPRCVRRLRAREGAFRERGRSGLMRVEAWEAQGGVG